MSIEQISIGNFSKMTRLTKKALRLYDKKGILIPEAKDEITGYRYYTVSQIEKGIKIKLLAWIGFGLSEITEILSSADEKNSSALNVLFSKKLTDTQMEIQRLQRIEDILLNNTPEELIYMNTTDPVIKELPKLRVISKRETGQYGPIIGKLIGELTNEIFSKDNQRNMVKITGPIIYICHDDGYKEFDADIEVAIPISGRIIIDDENIEIRNLKATKAVSVIYTGPYNEVGGAYVKLFKFLTINGYSMIGNSREVYLNDPEDVPESQLMTEIQIPIEKQKF